MIQFLALPTLALLATPDAALTATDPVIAIAAYAEQSEQNFRVPQPSVQRTFDEAAAKSARDPFVRAYASFSSERRAARIADVDGALAIGKGLGFVPAMRALGPFANTGGSAFATPLDVDVKAQNQRVPGLDRDVGWQTVPMEPTGELDLVPRLSPTKETRALLAVVVDAPADTPAALRIGSSGQVRALVNGAEVAKADVDRGLGLDQTSAGVQLKRGENLLVIEAGFISDDAELRVRFTKPDGSPIALTTKIDDASFARAAKVKPSALAAPAIVDPVALARATMTNATSATIPQLKAAARVEDYLHAGDLRKKPLDVESAFDKLRYTLEQKRAPANEIAQVQARIAGLLRQRDTTSARAEYEAALATDPSCVDALLGLADLRAEQEDVRAARQLYAKARAIAPDSDVVMRRFLEDERSAGHGGAEADLAIVQRAHDAPTEPNIELAADVLDERGDRAGALALLEKQPAGKVDAAKAIRLQSEMDAARSASDPHAVDDRVALLRTSLRMRNGNHSAAEALALTLAGAGRIDDAKAFAEERARAFPERAEPLALAAKLALVQGDRETARAKLVAALAIRPQDADLQHTLRAMSNKSDELVARYALDPAAYADDTASPEALKIGAHVVATTTAVRFFENGLGRIVTDRIIKVHDAKKVSGLSQFSFPYSEGREQLEILLAERISRDGRRQPAMRVVDNGPGGKEGGVYTDVGTKTVMLGQLADGDLIHVRTRKELVGMQNLFGDFFGDLEPIQGVIPVKHWRFVVEAPLSRELAWGGRGAPHPAIREEKDRRIYDFTVDQAPAIEPEPGMPPFLEEANFVSVSTYSSWQAMGAWYESMVAPQLVLDDDLKKVAHDIASTSHDEMEKVRRIYDHVVTGTRYVGIELGIHGWKPYPVTEVHRRKYGDCKDKAALLTALLREAGVNANMVLVRTANLGNIVPDPPSMWSFNHAIAYVPDLDLFLDGTAETSGFTETPPLDQGALVLIVGKHGSHAESELRTIPIKPADSNLNVSDYVLHLDADGTLTLHGTEKFRGSHNAEQRPELIDPATRAQILEKHLADVMPGAHVEKLVPSDLSLDNEEISYTFDAVLPERAVKESNGALSMAVSLYPHDLTGSYAEQSTRKTDIFIDHPWRTRNVMRYVLPAGFTVAELPAGGTVKSDHVAFTQKITKTPDGFIVDEDTSILTRRIPLKDYAAFRDSCLKADAMMKRKLRIVPTVGGAS